MYPNYQGYIYTEQIKTLHQKYANAYHRETVKVYFHDHPTKAFVTKGSFFSMWLEETYGYTYGQRTKVGASPRDHCHSGVDITPTPPVLMQ